MPTLPVVEIGRGLYSQKELEAMTDEARGRLLKSVLVARDNCAAYRRFIPGSTKNFECDLCFAPLVA